MSVQKPTSKEHFIPQCYLGQFSPDERYSDGKKKPFDRRHIYSYDLISGIQSPKPVLIKSICYEINLYEFKNDQGDFIYQNLIENILSVYEGHFATVFRSIRGKARCNSNLALSSFLSQEEKAYLIFFLSTLVLRQPEVINAGIEIAKESFENISKHRAKNLTLNMFLPIYRKIDEKEKNVLNVVMSWFDKLSFQVYVSDKDVFFTCDRPAVIIGKHNPHRISEVYLPISPRIMLNMIPEEKAPKGYRNRLMPLSDQQIMKANQEYSAHCKRWVYSKAPLTEQQVKMILDGRKRV